MRLEHFLGLTLLLSPGLLSAAEPEKAVPTLPAPRPVGPAALALPAVTGFYRPNPMAVWDFYALDRQGFFRPRVVMAPYQPYYAVTGKPYYWLATHPMAFMPYMTD